MDENKTTFEQEKQNLEISLARTIYTQLDQKALSYDEATEISRDILLKIDDVTNKEEMMSFLEELTQKWKIFGTINDLLKLKTTDSLQTAEKLEDVKEDLTQMAQ